MAAAVAAATPWWSPGKKDGFPARKPGSPDGVDQVLDFEEFDAAPATHNIPTCSLNSFDRAASKYTQHERTGESRLDEILSEEEDDKSPLTGADRMRLAAIMAEPDEGTEAIVEGLAKSREGSLVQAQIVGDDGVYSCRDDSARHLKQTRDETYAEGFKCYYQSPDKDPTSSSTRTLLRLPLQVNSDDDSRSDSDGGYRDSSEIILEVLIGRWRSILRGGIVFDGRAVCEGGIVKIKKRRYVKAVREVEIGKIKKRRYVKRGGGTRRHGRPPDLTFVGPFGNDASWNMGVYPGRGPALISRADMIILSTPPPRTPSAPTTLCPPEADEGVASPVDVLKGLPRNLFAALSGLSAAGNASPSTAKGGAQKSSEPPAPNPANFSH